MLLGNAPETTENVIDLCTPPPSTRLGQPPIHVSDVQEEQEEADSVPLEEADSTWMPPANEDMQEMPCHTEGHIDANVTQLSARIEGVVEKLLQDAAHMQEEQTSEIQEVVAKFLDDAESLHRRKSMEIEQELDHILEQAHKLHGDSMELEEPPVHVSMHGQHSESLHGQPSESLHGHVSDAMLGQPSDSLHGHPSESLHGQQSDAMLGQPSVHGRARVSRVRKASTPSKNPRRSCRYRG